MTIRHDAAKAYAHSRSETVRISQGLLTPEEQEKVKKAEAKRQGKEAAEARKKRKHEAKGLPLGLEEDQ